MLVSGGSICAQPFGDLENPFLNEGHSFCGNFFKSHPYIMELIAHYGVCFDLNSLDIVNSDNLEWNWVLSVFTELISDPFVLV